MNFEFQGVHLGAFGQGWLLPFSETRQQLLLDHVRVRRQVFVVHCALTKCRLSLYLDPQIRDWVLFPITLVMVSTKHFSLRRAYLALDSCRRVEALRRDALTVASEEPSQKCPARTVIRSPLSVVEC